MLAHCDVTTLDVLQTGYSVSFFLIKLFIRTIAAGPLCRLVPVDLVSFSRQVLCVKADRVPSPGPVRTIAEGH